MTEWSDVRQAIREGLLLRGLAEPRLRLTALDTIGERLANVYPGFRSDCRVVLGHGKSGVAESLAKLKPNGRLNGAEKSVLTEIFRVLEGAGSIQPRSAGQCPAVAAESGAATAIKHGLPPVVHDSAHVLVLGTMPGDESLRLQQYYANPGNHFWKIITDVYETAIGTSYADRIEGLHSVGIALWDVLRAAERVGSLDSAIKNEVPNEFAEFFTNYPLLRTVAFNGGKAARLFARHVAGSLPYLGVKLRTQILPSTSATPGRNVLSYEDKLLRWQEFLASLRREMRMGAAPGT